MKNNLAIKNRYQFSLAKCLFIQGCTAERITIPIITLMFISIFIPVIPVFAGLQQVFVDGQDGRFQEAYSELQRMSDELKAQVTSADVSIVGRNCAAIGFYSMLSKVASDCISSFLDPEYGKKLFTASENAALDQLDKAALLAKEITDAIPNYLQAQLILARIRMGSCVQRNKHCNEAIEIYQKVLGMDKALAVAYLDLGMLYQHMGKNQNAIEVWEIADKKSRDHAATKWTYLMLALLYATEQQWAQAKQYAHKAKDMGFTGFAAELLDEIQRHISSDSDSKGRELSTKDVNKDIKKPVDEKKSEPDIITGLWHGLTSPFRFFGLFDLNYEKKENWTGNYALGLVIGGLVILSIGLGLFNAKK